MAREIAARCEPVRREPFGGLTGEWIITSNKPFPGTFNGARAASIHTILQQNRADPR